MDLENTTSINSELIRGHINTIILNILYENDRYGYEIIQLIELKSNGQYSLKQPTLYSALKRLEQLDFVTSYWGTGMSNGGRRKYFQITDKGREFVLQNRAEWEYSRTIIDNLVSDKIFDFDKSTPPAHIDFTALKKRQAKTVHSIAPEKDIATPHNPSSQEIDNLTYSTNNYAKTNIDKQVPTIAPIANTFATTIHSTTYATTSLDNFSSNNLSHENISMKHTMEEAKDNYTKQLDITDKIQKQEEQKIDSTFEENRQNTILDSFTTMKNLQEEIDNIRYTDILASLENKGTHFNSTIHQPKSITEIRDIIESADKDWQQQQENHLSSSKEMNANATEILYRIESIEQDLQEAVNSMRVGNTTDTIIEKTNNGIENIATDLLDTQANSLHSNNVIDSTTTEILKIIENAEQNVQQSVDDFSSSHTIDATNENILSRIETIEQDLQQPTPSYPAKNTIDSATTEILKIIENTEQNVQQSANAPSSSHTINATSEDILSRIETIEQDLQHSTPSYPASNVIDSTTTEILKIIENAEHNVQQSVDNFSSSHTIDATNENILSRIETIEQDLQHSTPSYPSNNVIDSTTTEILKIIENAEQNVQQSVDDFSSSHTINETSVDILSRIENLEQELQQPTPSYPANNTIDSTTTEILKIIENAEQNVQQPVHNSSSSHNINETSGDILSGIETIEQDLQQPTHSFTPIDTTTEKIRQIIDTSEQELQMHSNPMNKSNWNSETAYTASSRQTEYQPSNQYADKINREHARQMHENYLKLIGDDDALQTHYVYTMLEAENPNFSATYSKNAHSYSQESIALDYHDIDNLSKIPYTTDTVWASSLHDDSFYTQDVPTTNSIQENLLEQLPKSLFTEDDLENKSATTENFFNEKYSDSDTKRFYTHLQEEVIDHYTSKLEDVDFIYDILEEEERLTNHKKSKKIHTFFSKISYSKLFVSIASFIFVLALAECLTIFFIGNKYSIGYQFALSIAVLYTIAYILSTIMATRQNANLALRTFADTKYMWYTILFYTIALIISIVTLYLLTKGFLPLREFWFYSISFNLLTFNIPLLHIFFCLLTNFKEKTKRDTL